MKRIMSLAVTALSLLFLAMFFTVAVKAEAHEDHCICGGTDDCIATAKKYGHEGTSTKGRTVVTWTEVSSTQNIYDAIAAAKAADETDVYVYVSADLQMTGYIGPSAASGDAANMHIHICLNGKTLTTKNNERLFMSWIQSSQANMKLSISDCSAGKTGKVQFAGTGINQQGAIATLDGNARIYLYGGELTGGKAGTYAGNIAIGSGQMYMYGGKVTNGRAKEASSTSNGYGGNIYVGSGKLVIYDGTISGGSAYTSSGNIHISGGIVDMYAGSIENGTARVKDDGTTNSGTGCGGNMRVSSGTFNMYGGKIIGGVNCTPTTDTNGHSIYVTGTVNVYGDSIIEAENEKSYPITTQSSSARINFYGNPTVYKKNLSTWPNLIQVTSKDSEVTFNGGSFYGTVSGHQGKIFVNGGYFERTISHSYNGSNGTLVINNGYFYGKSTSSALQIPDTVWKVNGNAWIPFTMTKTFTKADGSTGAFSIRYAVTSRKHVNGRNMTLNENLALALYADVNVDEPLYSTSKVTVSIGDDEREFPLNTAADYTDGRKTVVFDGVTPELMGDTITVKLYASNGTLLDTKTYTIKEYLETLKAKTATDLGYSDAKKTALDTLINDLLVYGGAAQTHFGHNIGSLVNDGIAGSGRVPDGDISDIWNKTAVTAANYQDASVIPGFFKEATAIHENTNWIRVKYVDNADDGETTFTIQKEGGTETAVTADGAYLCTDGLMPTEYGKRIVFRAYRGSEVISKTEYSMNSYCARLSSSTKHTAEMKAFAAALYNYGASAAEFAGLN